MVFPLLRFPATIEYSIGRRLVPDAVAVSRLNVFDLRGVKFRMIGCKGKRGFARRQPKTEGQFDAIFQRFGRQRFQPLQIIRAALLQDFDCRIARLELCFPLAKKTDPLRPCP